MKIFKNILLSMMVIICVFLSSKVWLQIGNILPFKSVEQNISVDLKNIDALSVIRPTRYFMVTKDAYGEVIIPDDDLVWQKSVANIKNLFSNFQSCQPILIKGEFYPENYITLEFDDSLPVELFVGDMKADMALIKERVGYINKIIFDLDHISSIYIYNGNSTVVAKDAKIDSTDVLSIIKKEQKNNFIEYIKDIDMKKAEINAPIPNIKTALNPVYVKSEINVDDEKTVEDIARKYFKNSFDYVRRSEEIGGDILYVYKNEKVLKISSEGLLDFFDSTVNFDDNSTIYQSFLAALKFSEKFLKFPKEMYLSSVEQTHIEGNPGYKFTFSYKINNMPIVFSKIRENKALEIVVNGINVVSYKRLFRNIDTSHNYEMTNYDIMDFKNVIAMQLEASKNDEMPSVINKSMLNKIKNVELGYFDLARKLNDQRLVVVWVVDIEDKENKRFIFNAITGALMEEQ